MYIDSRGCRVKVMSVGSAGLYRRPTAVHISSIRPVYFSRIRRIYCAGLPSCLQRSASRCSRVGTKCCGHVCLDRLDGRVVRRPGPLRPVPCSIVRLSDDSDSQAPGLCIGVRSQHGRGVGLGVAGASTKYSACERGARCTSWDYHALCNAQYAQELGRRSRGTEGLHVYLHFARGALSAATESSMQCCSSITSLSIVAQ
ncbi:hypothetical protein C7974DRAFT_15941 [Boeremia exigua]|uniref:uncharacterized protein n=1 Tax=Boeremia exigua TaxID=749465 RepID=UPI001E8D0151|nr:uncharacterized protein C7974DRAFT_15941 [Boeremia exigua]KAH6644170.1 hypothetical protein C7974DRAFT_15941 [Boeremia exigua]